jgi:hypothetical protein
VEQKKKTNLGLEISKIFKVDGIFFSPRIECVDPPILKKVIDGVASDNANQSKRDGSAKQNA